MGILWRGTSERLFGDGAVAHAEVGLAGHVDEEAVLNDAGDHVERRLDRLPVGRRLLELPVQDEVAVVRHHRTLAVAAKNR